MIAGTLSSSSPFGSRLLTITTKKLESPAYYGLKIQVVLIFGGFLSAFIQIDLFCANEKEKTRTCDWIFLHVSPNHVSPSSVSFANVCKFQTGIGKTRKQVFRLRRVYF